MHSELIDMNYKPQNILFMFLKTQRFSWGRCWPSWVGPGWERPSLGPGPLDISVCTERDEISRERRMRCICPAHKTLFCLVNWPLFVLVETGSKATEHQQNVHFLQCMFHCFVFMETPQFNEDVFLWSLKTVFHVFHVSETEYPVGKNVGRGFVLSDDLFD